MLGDKVLVSQLCFKVRLQLLSFQPSLYSVGIGLDIRSYLEHCIQLLSEQVTRDQILFPPTSYKYLQCQILAFLPISVSL